MNPATTFTIRTFGCKVNQYDSQLLAERLGALGLELVDDRSPHASLQAADADEADRSDEAHRADEADGADETAGPGAVARPNRAVRRGEPDLVVVNTCAVTARSEAKGRRLVRWLLRSYPHATVVLTGCAVRLDPRPWEAIGRDRARPDEAGRGTTSARLLLVPSPEEVPRRLVEAGLVATGGLSRGPLASDSVPRPSNQTLTPARPQGGSQGERARVRVSLGHPNRISGFLGHDRAFVKVQDGCQAFCSYCVVPLVRPVLWSKPARAVVEEVRALSEAGYGEVVLVGVHLGLYGGEASADSASAAGGGLIGAETASPGDGAPGGCRTPVGLAASPQGLCPSGGRLAACHPDGVGEPLPHTPWAPRVPDLAGLIRRLLAETDVGRLRLSSIEPREVTDDLIDLAAESDRLCPHFHLPLQSGDDSVLGAMNRRYTAQEYLGTLDRIARKIPRPAFTTDILLGFPGEGEAEFARTLSVVRQARFSRIHAFRYSPRPGTKAAALPGGAPQREVREREHALLTLAAELARSYRNQFLGEPVEVLVEGPAERSASPTLTQPRPGGAPTVRGGSVRGAGPPAGCGGQVAGELRTQEFLAGVSERYLRVRFPRPGGVRVRPGSLVRVRVLSSDDTGMVGEWEPRMGSAEKRPSL